MNMSWYTKHCNAMPLGGYTVFIWSYFFNLERVFLIIIRLWFIGAAIIFVNCTVSGHDYDIFFFFFFTFEVETTGSHYFTVCCFTGIYLKGVWCTKNKQGRQSDLCCQINSQQFESEKDQWWHIAAIFYSVWQRQSNSQHTVCNCTGIQLLQYFSSRLCV